MGNEDSHILRGYKNMQKFLVPDNLSEQQKNQNVKFQQSQFNDKFHNDYLTAGKNNSQKNYYVKAIHFQPKFVKFFDKFTIIPLLNYSKQDNNQYIAPIAKIWAGVYKSKSKEDKHRIMLNVFYKKYDFSIAQYIKQCDYAKQGQIKIKINNINKLMISALKGYKHLLQKGCPIKCVRPEKILFNSSSQNAVVSDYGIREKFEFSGFDSKFKSNDSIQQQYISPQFYKKDIKSDGDCKNIIWGLGILYYRLVKKHSFYQFNHISTFMQKLQTNNVKFDDRTFKEGDKLKDIVKKMLVPAQHRQNFDYFISQFQKLDNINKQVGTSYDTKRQKGRAGSYQLIYQLGDGHYGTVYKCKSDFIIQRIQDSKKIQEAKQEYKKIKFYENDKHNLHMIVQAFYQNKIYYRVQPYLQCNLQTMIKSKKEQKIQQNIAIDYLLLIINSYRYLIQLRQHTHFQLFGIEDIWFKKKDGEIFPSIKLVHFKSFFNKRLPQQDSLYYCPFTKNNIKDQINSQNQIWAFGLVLYRMIEGSFPWGVTTADQLKNQIQKCKKIKFGPKNTSKTLKKLLQQQVFNVQQSQRITIQQLQIQLQNIDKCCIFACCSKLCLKLCNKKSEKKKINNNKTRSNMAKSEYPIQTTRPLK